jgi:uncharacterized peroxidase-related enzyme
MAYINTGIDQAGIIELLFYKGSTGQTLAAFTQALMQGPSGLSPAEREIIAAYVSNLNGCEFCQKAHTAIAGHHLGDGGETVACVLAQPSAAPISAKLKALLDIARKVQLGGREVSPDDIQAARAQGASDEDIHDAVLVSAAFCMFNRYVDGLGARLPEQEDEYTDLASTLAKQGYRLPPRFLRKFVLWLMARKKNRKKLPPR